jgi:excisionase family DNA binding protein
VTLASSPRFAHTAFLTTSDVLQQLRVNARTVYRLIREGDLPAVRVGRQWRVRRTDFDAWLESRRPSRDA